MDSAIAMQEWVNFLSEEYLESFIKDGGASVKFAVTPEAMIDDLVWSMAEQARARGCAFVEINAVHARVHMPQDIFHAISRQVDWRWLTRSVIVVLADRLNYRIDSIDPSEPGVYDAIGKANGLDAGEVLRELRVAVRDFVATNRHMARDFRVAMSHLCLLENVGENGQYNGQPLIDWLTGENLRIGNVRHFGIHAPINRTSARHYMESALYWIGFAGYSGTVALLDTTRVTLARRPPDGSRFYTKAMVIDHYELLRELIDTTDRLSRTLMVIATGPDFLDEDTRSRGFGSYPALMTRVMNDVRDKNLANPMASLVRLS